jgi:hypothetical protein
LHLETSVAKGPESSDIDGSFHHGGIFLQDLELVAFWGWLGPLLSGFAQAFVQILPKFVRLSLHPDPHVRLDAMISVVNQAAGFPQGMKRADLMRNPRPEFGHRLQFGGLSIADNSQDGHIQSDHGR